MLVIVGTSKGMVLFTVHTHGE